MNLHYKISGSGPVLILVHGAYINSDIWYYQEAYFKQFFRVLSVDLRGHGKTPSSELPEYRVDTFGEDLLHLMDELGIQKATFCGLSLGAMIAQYLAASYPSRIEGIVLVGATASLRLSMTERIITTLVFPKWIAMQLFRRLSTKEFMKISFFLTWFMLGNKWLGNVSTRDKIRKSIAQVSRTELKKIYNAIYSFRLQDLKTGTFPVLLLSGENDSPVIHRHSDFIQRKVGKRGRHHKIESAGHACNHDQPLLFNQLMHDWFQETGILNSKKERTIGGLNQERIATNPR